MLLTRILAVLALSPLPAFAAAGPAPEVFGIPVDFILFAATLLGVALFHHYTLRVALIGLCAILAYKFLLVDFSTGPGFGGFVAHMKHEWALLSNLLMLLVGFALLSDHFEKSRIPDVLPRFLPDDWRGGFVLLVMIFVLSAFLDNIAAALIGGTIAGTVFRGKVHIGYLAAIVGASNAGGAGSVVGDTTTTMMWIDGVDPRDVIEAFIGSGVALIVFGIPAACLQHRYSPISEDPPTGVHVDWARVGIVAAILVTVIVVNVVSNLKFGHLTDHVPFLGLSVWAAILATAGVRRPHWALVPGAARGAVFLLSLVLCASLMPVERLPAASWQTALGLGFVSAVFDNIPLTALALKQGGYDWGFLAYAVGFGGSMIWFGSSAGVALSSMYPEAKSVGAWLRHGWFIAVAYVAGFVALLLVLGWHPNERHKAPLVTPPAVQAPAR